MFTQAITWALGIDGAIMPAWFFFCNLETQAAGREELEEILCFCLDSTWKFALLLGQCLEWAGFENVHSVTILLWFCSLLFDSEGERL